jgi:redox-sensitive bicupin YhaK (pirin superfamily)
MCPAPYRVDGNKAMSETGEVVELVIPALERDLGGFRVGRILPSARRRMVGPFTFLDHLGPLVLEAPIPRSADVRPHPHIGLSTVTYLFQGEMTHRDSLGIEQVIRPGEVNWMTAGRGISHSERFDGMRTRGGALHGLQAWVALPEAHEEDDPSFEHYGRDELQAFDLPGAQVRLIAGSAFGRTSRVRTRSPLVYAHLEMPTGSLLELPADYPERALYVVSGSINVNGSAFASKSMIVVRAGATPQLAALEHSTVMLLGGEPVGQRFVWWNFVASRRERIEQAKSDWSEGRIPLPPADSSEWIPLPERG